MIPFSFHACGLFGSGWINRFTNAVSSERLKLRADFPSSNVLVRNPEGEPSRSLYLTNDLVKNIIQHNDYARLRLTFAGTKILSKQEGGKGVDAQFRILGEGLPVVLPYLDPSSVISGDLASLKTMIKSYYPLCSSFEDPFKSTIENKGEFRMLYLDCLLIDYNRERYSHRQILA